MINGNPNTPTLAHDQEAIDPRMQWVGNGDPFRRRHAECVGNSRGRQSPSHSTHTPHLWKKRISLAVRYPSDPKELAKTLPLFKYCPRIPDQLVSSARFRPEALRRVRATREEEIRKIRKVDEDEKAICAGSLRA